MKIIQYRLVTIALLLSFLCSHPAWAGPVGRPTGHALQFGCGNSLSVGKFNGTTIAYRRSISPNVDWRLGASINLEYGSGEVTASGTGTEAGEDSGPVETWYNSVELRCEWLAYSGERVSFYVGGGPHVALAYSQGMQTSFYFSDDYEDETRHYKNRNTTFGLGAGGVMGVQWAPVEWCALHVEYRAVAMYERALHREYSERDGGTHEYTLQEERTTDAFRFTSRGAAAGISIYF